MPARLIETLIARVYILASISFVLSLSPPPSLPLSPSRSICVVFSRSCRGGCGVFPPSARIWRPVTRYRSTASVNPSGRDFPWALRLAACMLLFEITAFLRDSYRRLPRSTRVSLRSEAGKQGVTGSLNVGSGSCRDERAAAGAPAGAGAPAAAATSGDPGATHQASGSLALATGATPAAQPGGRRWSMALSSMGQSQASAQSLQSIPGDGQSFGKHTFPLSLDEFSLNLMPASRHSSRCVSCTFGRSELGTLAVFFAA